MKRSQKANPDQKFGSFLEYSLKRLDDPQGTSLLEAVLDPKAVDTYSDAKRAKEALAASEAAILEVQVLRAKIAALESGKKRRRGAPLKGLIRSAKQELPDSATQLEITRHVDKQLERIGKDLRTECPAGWSKKYKVPRLFADTLKPGADLAFKENVVKPYITRA